MTETSVATTTAGLPGDIQQQGLVKQFVAGLVERYPFAVPTIASFDVPRLGAFLTAANRLAQVFPVVKLGTPAETGLPENIGDAEFLAWWVAQLELLVASEVRSRAESLQLELRLDTVGMTVEHKILFLQAVYCLRGCQAYYQDDDLRACYEAHYQRAIAQLAEQLPSSRGTGPDAPSSEQIWLQTATFWAFSSRPLFG